MAEGADDRTEAPSQRRIEKAREEGNVAVSRELSMLASVSAGLLMLSAQASDGAGIVKWFAGTLRRASESADAGPLLMNAAEETLSATAPIWLAAAGCYAATTLLQTSFLVHSAALQPDIGRLSPLKGIKRMFGLDTLSQAAKAAAKLAVLIFGFVVALRRILPQLADSSSWQPTFLLHQLVQQSSRLLMLLLGAHVAIAGVDFAWVRFQHSKRLRMSKQELRDEHKESEGNPQVKQRLRQVARARARRRMMAAVPKAAVVITNPTHFAVALAYDRGARGAPRVVAKGADDIAARIREVAKEAGVPLVANPPLARALYRVDIDTEIPAEHFKAVAEIIAYLWQLRGRVARL